VRVYGPTLLNHARGYRNPGTAVAREVKREGRKYCKPYVVGAVVQVQL